MFFGSQCAYFVIQKNESKFNLVFHLPLQIIISKFEKYFFVLKFRYLKNNIVFTFKKSNREIRLINLNFTSFNINFLSIQMKNYAYLLFKFLTIND